MNNPQVREYAAGLRRVGSCPAAGTSPAEAVERAYRIALGRARRTTTSWPTPWPSSASRPTPTGPPGRPNALAPALADFCQVLMGLNEFIYIE